MTEILNGVRILDFGRYIAGPLSAALLGDFGADVIRIERREGGEDRFLFPQSTTGDGATFLHSNRNKRGMTLDVRHERGREVLARLVAGADVVIANLPQPTLENMGLGYEQLRELNPNIILASVSAFGPVGPYREKVGFDSIGQSMSGSIYMSGTPDQPAKAYANWVDVSTALMTAFGVMAALRERDMTGQGQEVRNNLLKTAMTVVNSLLIDQHMSAPNRHATGNRGQTGGPVDMFRTADGWIMVQVIGDPLFKRWAKLVDVREWLDDPRFANDTARGDNGALISARMATWCSARTTQAALAELSAARLPAGPVLSPQQILEDPHVLETEMLDYVSFPGAETKVPMVKPMELSKSQPHIHCRPPLLGEHNDEILAELGYGENEIDELIACGAV